MVLILINKCEIWREDLRKSKKKKNIYINFIPYLKLLYTRLYLPLLAHLWARCLHFVCHIGYNKAIHNKLSCRFNSHVFSSQF